MILTKKPTKEMVQGETEVKKQKPKKIWEIGKNSQDREKKEKSLNARSPLFRTKTFWGAISILLGVIIAFMGIPMLHAAVSETQQTVCFAQNVKAGTRVTEDLLTTSDMSAYHMPLDTIYDLQTAVGQYVKVDALAGDIVTASRLSEGYPGADPQLADVPAGMVAIAISLPDLAQSVSGKLRAGDVIQLFAVEDNNSFIAVAPPELQFVEVLAATYTDGGDVQDQQDQQGDVQSQRDTLSTVTLLANGKQAACLAGMEHNATLHAALVVRGDDAAKAAALDVQNDFFTASDVPEEDQSKTQASPAPAPSKPGAGQENE